MGKTLRSAAYSLEELRRHFATAEPPAESVYGDPGARPRRERLAPASVLVPIVAHAGGPTMLFTRRAAHLRNHSGQVSFPGGRVAAGDASPEATALRESREEIGLDSARVELLGRLPEYRTRTGFRITPVVAVLEPPLELAPDADEVDEIFEVPLAFLLDPANHRRRWRVWRGRRRWFFAMQYQRHTIWGATAGMLVNLYRFLSQGRLREP
ncbi:MAG: CoA pyrophosphatase [Pseudomonadota bacterium]